MSAHNLLEELGEAQSLFSIVDPGASGTIKANGRSFAICNIATAAAESRTLPAPEAAGQYITLAMATDGGDCTITITGGWNEAGDTSYVFTDPGQFLLLTSVVTRTSNIATPSYVWRAVSSDALANMMSTSDNMVSATSSTLTVTEAEHNNKTILLDLAAGIAVTLPAAKAGLEFTFIVKTTFTGAASIKSVSGADIMIGHAIMGNNESNSTVRWPAIASDTFDTINLFGTANSTGGIEGQIIKIRGLATNLWHVEMCGDAAGTEATPFENTVA